MLVGERITDPKIAPTVEYLKKLLNLRLPIIQFSKPNYSKRLIKNINVLCKLFGSKIEVRFFGHYGSTFDASILAYLPDVQRLSIDCLQDISNISSLYKLKSIKHLSFGVYNFDNADFLSKMHICAIKELRLSETKKRNIDLTPISDICTLKILSICGHTKGINSIGQSRTIQDLTLNSIPKKQNLKFVSNMTSLMTLKLMLGGRQNIDEITLSNLEKLSIVRVRGFNDLGDLSRFPNLQNLEIGDQIQLISISTLGLDLREIKIFNCKNLEHIDNLQALDRLKHLHVYQTKLDLEKMCLIDWPESLKYLTLYSGHVKRDKKIRKTLDGLRFKEFN